MKVLVTSARLPHALGVIRALGEAGHAVLATDTFRTAPGLVSHYAKERLLTAAPAFETRRFVGEISAAVRSYSVDLVVPAFEEVFYLARHLAEEPERERYFCAPLEILYRLHDKQRFVELARELDLPIGRTLSASSPGELAAAIGEFDEYFARPAFSRGGVSLLTNTGPLAGAVRPEDCQPTGTNPWLVQEFVRGEDLCSMSVAHHGRVSAHCSYRHPLTIEHAGGIVFESVDEPETLTIAQKLVGELGYHGHISLDWLRSADGALHLVECNPRPTAAIFTMDRERYAKALFDPDFSAPYVAEPGAREQIGVAILRDMFREPRDIPQDLHRLFDGTRDVYAEKGDRLPGLYALLSYAHVLSFRRRMHVSKHRHSDLVAAQFFDIAWDGGEIA